MSQPPTVHCFSSHHAQKKIGGNMFTKRTHKGRSLTFGLVLVISLILPLVLGSTTGFGLAASFDGPPYQGEPITALQTELAEAISQRQAAGLPVPTVTFSAQSVGDESFDTLSQPNPQDMTGETTTVTATTILYFDGPQEAGYDEWPAQEISGNLAGDEATSFATGDFTEAYRDTVEKLIPDFWQQVEFGQEARRYSITETTEFTSPSNEPQLVRNLVDSTEVSTDGDILMGFTFTGPHIKKFIESSAEACLPWWLGGDCFQFYYLKAGFELDWALGLRLPASVNLTGPDQVEQGSNAYFQTSLTPQNWDGMKYAGYGVAPGDGSEFVLRFTFFAGVLLEVLGADVCPLPACYVNLSYDAADNYETSFITPFGTGSSFPLPTIDIPLYELDIAIFEFSTSLTITPLLTSTQITADWHTVSGSDCSGGGTVTYSEPNIPVTFGPVLVCNLDNDPNTNQAQVELENFRYHFNSFQLQLGAKVYINVFGVYEHTFEAPIFTLDLSSIFGGLGLYVGDHMQCAWDSNAFPPYVCSQVGPSKVSLSITTKDETPPITSIVLPSINGAHGWYVSDVQFSLSAEDTCGSSVDKTEYSFDNTSWDLYTAPVLLTDEGVNTVYYRSIDKEGNQEAVKSQIIMIDKTPPVITGAPTTLPTPFGWWNDDVVVHFEATDAVSGIDFVTPDVTISAEGAGQSAAGTAIDMAGNIAHVTVGDINIDKTPPVVTITSPLPLIYNNTDSFTIQWTALDSLSGIDTETGDMDGTPVDNGQLVELQLVAAGEHSVTVLAVDKADNATTSSVDFFVQTDIDGLIASVEYMCEMGWIESPGTCNSLLAKLNNAKNAIDRGQCSTAENVLNAFINEVKALIGKQLTEEAANVSTANAEYVIENLECTVAFISIGGLPDNSKN